MILNDSEIREALIDKLNNQAKKPHAIVEELRVRNGNAIADVVALYKDAHCYEIKGVNDKIERIITQGSYYDTAFKKITLVTTENHISKAFEIAPDHWGIVKASVCKEEVKLCSIRRAKTNPYFSKELAALTLWKSEMLELIEEKKYKSKPRDFLAKLIAQTKRKPEVSSEICLQLLQRYASKSA